MASPRLPKMQISASKMYTTEQLVKYWDGFYVHGRRPDSRTVPIPIVGCEKCILFRSRGRGELLPGVERCQCINSGCHGTCREYWLNPRDFGITSDFQQYRAAIIQQLESNERFFRDRVIDELQDPVMKSLSCRDQVYIEITIDIEPDEATPTGKGLKLKKGFNVKALQQSTKPFPEELEITNTLSYAKTFGRQRNYLKGDRDLVGVGIAIEFGVHYKEGVVVRFALQVMLSFERDFIKYLEARPSGWINQIEDAFGDRRKMNPQLEPMFKLFASLEPSSLFAADLNHLSPEEVNGLIKSLKAPELTHLENLLNNRLNLRRLYKR